MNAGPAFSAEPPRPPKGGKRKRRRLNVETFARCRAAGMSQADAARAAGARGDDLAHAGARLEADPAVQRLVQAYAGRVPDAMEEAWRAGEAWVLGVLSGALPATHFDRVACMTLAGKARGKFTERTESHVFHHLPYVSTLPGRGMVLPDGVPASSVPALPAGAPGDAGDGSDNDPSQT